MRRKAAPALGDYDTASGTYGTSQPVRLGDALTIDQVRDVASNHRKISLPASVLDRVSANRGAFEAAINGGYEVYGVRTGVGARVVDRLSPERARGAQVALLRSHAAGTGEALPAPFVRAGMLVRLNSLAQAHSGVRAVVLERIAELLNAGLTPQVPSIGSLGASGDLAPSAHAFRALIGEGVLYDRAGRRHRADEAMRRYGIDLVELESKEGLALINGTHFMAGAGAIVGCRARQALNTADLGAALALEACRGHLGAFDPRVHNLRPVPGQARVAANVRRLVSGSTRVRTEGMGQDAYSLRCVPQVHGAAREATEFYLRLVNYDLQAATDNPVVFTQPFDVVSAGNFHGQTLALAFDTLRLALADLASMAERRVFRLLSPSTNGCLPPFLTRHGADASGYMLLQYTAAALLAELRALAQPVSIDNVPTCDNQEDHVSMGMTSALMTVKSVDRLERLLAIEWIVGCQAIDLCDGGRLGAGTAHAYALVRAVLSPLDADRPPADDIDRVLPLVRTERTASLFPLDETAPA